MSAALAPDAGTADLRHAKDGSWGYSLYEDAADAVGSERVKLATLPEILGADRPDIVKCNAEGAEFTLVRQLEDGADRPALMIVMVHPAFGDLDDLLRRGEHGVRDLVDRHPAATRVPHVEDGRGRRLAQSAQCEDPAAVIAAERARRVRGARSDGPWRSPASST